MKEFLIILDAGHGPETPGKRSPVWPDGRQLFEYEFNRDIVDRLAKGLRELGIDYFIVSDKSKDTPLLERVARAEEAAKGYKKSLYLSIHANAGGGTGWEVFTSPGKTKSDQYATIFFIEAETEFTHFRMRSNRGDGDPDKEARFTVLTKTSMPAVLTENFFMDTLDPDCELLMSEEGRARIAKFHMKAIKKILKQEST